MSGSAGEEWPEAVSDAHTAEALRAAIEAAGIPSAGQDLMVALDIDGTVLRHNNTMSARVGAALRQHQEAGTHLCLATGRGIYGTRDAAAKAGVGGFAVCSNGAITIDLGSGSVLDVATFDPSPAIEALYGAVPDALFAVESLTEPRRITGNFPEGELSGPSVIVPIDELSIPNATRLTVRHPGMSSTELSTVAHEVGLNGVEYAIGWTAWLDVSPEGVSKASGLDALASRFGGAATVAVGDGGNDVEMLTWARLGVAMAQASQDVKRAADVVTASVDDDGLALLLEALL